MAEELRSLGDVVVGVGAPPAGIPSSSGAGACRTESPEAARLVELLGLAVFASDDGY